MQVDFVLHFPGLICLLFVQVLAGFVARPPKTAMLRRAWNIVHWTVGRATLALAIANIFIGFFLSNVAHHHIIAQAVVLGALLIIYLLKNDIEYLLIRVSPAEEDRRLKAAQQPGMSCQLSCHIDCLAT